VKVVVIGAGLLGREVVAVLQHAGHEAELVSRSTGFDVTDPSYARLGADAVVNTAAYTNVDAAEYETREAYKVNAGGAEKIARMAKRTRSRLIHISTDAVFHATGLDGVRRTELDTPCPASVYGRSKLLGEQLAMSEYPETTIVRVANLYGEHGRNFGSKLQFMLKDQLMISTDKVRQVAPTWARWPAEVITELLDRDHRGPLYHVCPKDLTTWHGFAERMSEAMQRTALLRPTVIRYQAPRSRVGALDSVMLPLRGIDIPTWDELLSRYLGAERGRVMEQK